MKILMQKDIAKQHWHSFLNSGELSIEDESKEILGEIHGYELFYYLYNRFGNSDIPIDEYKDTVRYWIKTSMDGVALQICPKPYATTMHFGIALKRHIYNKLLKESFSKKKQWLEDFHRWAKYYKGVMLLSYRSGYIGVRMNGDKFRWGDNKFSKKESKILYSNAIELGIETAEEYWEFKELEYSAYEAKFKDICPMPSHSYIGELHIKIKKALINTIKKLRHPTWQRDVEINILTQ